MKDYTVDWSRNVQARGVIDAAKQALEAQRTDGASATVFTVTGPDGTALRVDLTEQDVTPVEGSRFTIADEIDEETGQAPAEWREAGDLVGIVDADQDGIVAFCHRELAPYLMTALAARARS